MQPPETKTNLNKTPKSHKLPNQSDKQLHTQQTNKTHQKH